MISIATQLRTAGVTNGHDVLIHCSMRRVRQNVSPKMMLDAFRAVIGPAATVVVPAQTSDNSNTSRAHRAATSELDGAGTAAFEARMPGFDPATTPSYGMGAFAEYVRRHPHSVRSGHPQTSFAALGPAAARLMSVHDVDCHLGERSPLGPLYHGQTLVALIGVGYEACTALHLAEYRLPWLANRPYRCYVMRDGVRIRLDFAAPDLNDSDFGRIGKELDREPFTTAGLVGDGTVRVFPIRPAVDFAANWMLRNRLKR